MNEEKIITHLGKIEGNLLFFGGVYSNLQALSSLKKWAEDRFIISGIYIDCGIPITKYIITINPLCD